jgi:hypothetical protein
MNITNTVTLDLQGLDRYCQCLLLDIILNKFHFLLEPLVRRFLRVLLNKCLCIPRLQHFLLELITLQIRRWADNIKIDLRIGWDGMDWIDLAEDRDQWRALVKAVMKLRVP